jgi:hypothetical protein
MAYFHFKTLNSYLWVSGNWIEDIQGDKSMKNNKHIYTLDIKNQTITNGKDFEYKKINYSLIL